MALTTAGKRLLPEAHRLCLGGTLADVETLRSLGQIRDDMIERRMPEIGATPENPDYQMLARAFGCYAVKPRSLKEVAEALRSARLPRTSESLLRGANGSFTSPAIGAGEVARGVTPSG